MGELSPVLRRKPKSIVVIWVATAVAFVVAMPMLSAGNGPIGRNFQILGALLLLMCWLVGILMSLVYVVGSLSGRYDALEERDWERQVW